MKVIMEKRIAGYKLPVVLLDAITLSAKQWGKTNSEYVRHVLEAHFKEIGVDVYAGLKTKVVADHVEAIRHTS